ncbi:uncharacterized protein FA14DRAFT_158147 [Meira miltonrushii]|uniref:Uncharacterized protein n=1 Tax=Meira miltonrushii TaxID=1280837 RepID=A0A316V9P4_9BASI|nr:uncharacterized protein FA14DRAFT_158147 [Meira miltonrushii]PWN32215.1 hypothetical protein FA14DRAFT_158147 [Meira miltonrushii]
MCNGKHTMFRLFLFLLAFILISSTHSKPAGEETKDNQTFPRKIILSAEEVKDRRLDEITASGRIMLPVAERRAKMHQKSSFNPTRIIDKYHIMKQEKKNKLHKDNYTNLRKILETGGTATLGKSKSGKRLSYTNVVPHQLAESAS